MCPTPPRLRRGLGIDLECALPADKTLMECALPAEKTLIDCALPADGKGILKARHLQMAGAELSSTRCNFNQLQSTSCLAFSPRLMCQRTSGDENAIPCSTGITKKPSHVFVEPKALPYIVVPETWVVKWIDLKCKYGLGYTLANGSIGIHFNDGSKVVATSEHSFDYMSRRIAGHETRSSYSGQDYPEDLAKKAKLLWHFKAELANPDSNLTEVSHMPATHEEAIAKGSQRPEKCRLEKHDPGFAITVRSRFAVSGAIVGNICLDALDFVWHLHDALKLLVAEAADGEDMDGVQWTLQILFGGKALHEHMTLHDAGIYDGAEVSVVKVITQESQPTYVQKWVKRNGVILFQFGSQAASSDRVVQAIFPDGMALVLSTKSQEWGKVVTHIDKEGEMRSYALSSFSKHRHTELGRSLSVVREMLQSILTRTTCYTAHP